MNRMDVHTLEGRLVARPESRFCLVAARFNARVVDALIAGAVGALDQHGVAANQVTLVRVPGAWELGWACRRIADSGRADAIVALGAVVRGATPHFDYVAGEATKALASVAQRTGVVTTLGLLTTDTMEQATDRAGGKAGNKGADAALAALELVSLAELLKS